MVPHPLTRLNHVSMGFVNTMALSNGIIASSCLTHKRIHWNVIILYTLGIGCYIAIIIRLIEGLNPRNIRRNVTSQHKGTGK